MSVPNKADGLRIIFNTSDSEGEITELASFDSEREEIDASHLGLAVPAGGTLGNEVSIPACITMGGRMEVEAHFDPDKVPPFTLENEVVTIRFKTPAGATDWDGLAYFTSYAFKGAMKEKLVLTFGLKFTGPVTGAQILTPLLNDDSNPVFDDQDHQLFVA